MNRKLQSRTQKLSKWTLQFLFSVTVLSAFPCHCYSSSANSFKFNVCFSTFLFSFFTHTLQRKYMFLLCNGILAFLARTFLSSAASAFAPPVDMPLASHPLDCTAAVSINQEKEHQGEEAEREAVVAARIEAEGDESLCTEEEDEMESEAPIRKDQGEKGEKGSVFLTKEEKVQNPAPANEELSCTKELNRKVEEFIRKMKEEIRIEAQSHPIAVQC